MVANCTPRKFIWPRGGLEVQPRRLHCLPQVRGFRSGKKCNKSRSTKIKFLGPETARWGGGLPREGVVAKNFVPALETLSSLGFEERNPGCPGNFAGMSRTPGGVQKVCAKKLRAHFSFPNTVGLPSTPKFLQYKKNPARN